MPKPPATVLLGSQLWSITESDPTTDPSLYENAFGYTLERSNRIVLDKHLPESRKRQVLLHELLHAMRFTFGNPSLPVKGDVSDWEHYFIAIYEEGVLLMLRDNPELSDYLTDPHPLH
jgi:hypothetical protein